MAGSRIIVGVDTGGTFTDFIFVERGRIRVDKRPSRPADPVAVIEEGVAAYLRERAGPAGAGLSDRELIAARTADLVLVHGTTVATNAVLEGKTARTCLVTNRGFEDVIEIGRQERLEVFRLPARKSPVPVPRRLRFGVAQRTLHDGSEEVRLTAAEIAAAARRAARSGARAAAVSLLYSFLNPEPEEKLAGALRAAGLDVAVSSRVAPEFREYERTATTVINASLKPVVGRYLNRLEEVFGGATTLVMSSAGGVVPPRETAERPVIALLSGPAGGTAGAAALMRVRAALPGARRGPRGSEARRRAAGAGVRGATDREVPSDRAITFDMGGTSTDVALVDGEPLRRHQSSIEGIPLLVPSIDIHTVGAGGGSRIWIDPAGALRVGPESTGADPGPACYGKAFEPALTDAHVALGRLGAGGLLNGAFPLDASRSAAALVPLARRLGVPPGALCRAVLDVADAVVEKAIRVITLGRGRDPRDYPLLAFGGAGGLHACRLMLAMGLPAVLVPPDPGILSAAGIAGAELREERSLGVAIALRENYAALLKRAFDRIEEGWRRERQAAASAGPAASARRVSVIKEVDLRYRGQSFQLTLPFDGGRGLAARFHRAHQERYGHSNADGEVEAVAVRARFRLGKGLAAGSVFGRRAARGDGRRPEPESFMRPGAGFGRGATPCYRRRDLRPGDVIAGPAVVTEFSATTVVEKGCVLEVDPAATMVITKQSKHKGL